MVRVKICGITKIEDAILAAESGVWAIGFIFYSKSPRYITPENAQNISQKMKEYGVKTVGVFVNENAENISKIAQIAQLDYVQLHGEESIEECNKLEIPFIKNIRKIEDMDKYKNAFAFLVDAYDTEQWGGTGALADWDLARQIKMSLGQYSKPDFNRKSRLGLPTQQQKANNVLNTATNKPLILSGGLSSSNIMQAINEVNPDIVDVSSKLELSPGVKNHNLMKEFFEKVKNGD